MSRPQRCRRVCAEPRFSKFAAHGSGSSETICLSTDEYEVLRLVDYERKTHEECAKQMDISRTTVTEIYDSARQKIANFLVNGYKLEISGGNYRICDGTASRCCEQHCYRNNEMAALRSAEAVKIEKPQGRRRIAVAYERGMVFPHFGHTERFRVCEVEDGKIVSKTLVDTSGSAHGTLPDILRKLKIDTLICGGIGAVAVKSLQSSAIQVISGISGDADKAVADFINGKLKSGAVSVCSNSVLKI